MKRPYSKMLGNAREHFNEHRRYSYSAHCRLPCRSDPVQQWITTNAVRLNTVSAGDGFDDMKPLKKIIGDSRIVALGEATHGTREFFQLKHRMLEFLATEMGFTLFSIEVNMPEAYRI